MEIGDWISWVCPSWVDNQERVEIMLRKDPWGTFFLPCCRTQPTRNSKIPASPKSLQLISVTLLLSFRCEGHQKWLEAHYNCNHDFDNNGYKAVLRSNVPPSWTFFYVLLWFENGYDKLEICTTSLLNNLVWLLSIIMGYMVALVVALCLFNTSVQFIDNITGFWLQVNMETNYSWMTRQGFSYTS